MLNFKSPVNLPPPTPEALAHSQQLLALIKDEITATGSMTFARYMQLCLYAPGLGYYSAGLHKFGSKGDFVTAPEISPWFARCLARQCQQALQMVGGGDVLEFGAGTGIMAADLLNELHVLKCLPDHYYILEVSAELRERQRATLEKHCPDFLSCIHWLDSLPEKDFSGVILANEVLDAMPVHKFALENKAIKECYITCENRQLVWRNQKPSNEILENKISVLQKNYLQEINDYSSEINLFIKPWLQSLADILKQGVILLIDYGFPQREYYHFERATGTLMCHYRQHAHSDPLLMPGLQDITVHVDFTEVAESAILCDLQVAGYTSQAAFLLACGLVEMTAVQAVSDIKQQLLLSQQLQKLTALHEMGELFKVIALTKNISEPLLGFQLQDRRDRL